MKKRFLSWLLICVMVLGTMSPVSALSGIEANSASDGGITITIEKYDADGNGAYLTEPATMEYEWGREYVPSMIKWYLADDYWTWEGDNYVKYEGDYITDVIDSSQEDGWLSNGEITDASRWKIVWNGNVLADTTTGGEKAKQGDVIRYIFSPEGDGSERGVNKDALIKYLADLSDAEKTRAGEAYAKASEMVLNMNATEEEVSAALSELDAVLNPPVPATGISLEPAELVLAVGQQPVELKAALTPSDSTDKITWSIDDEAVAAVENGYVSPAAEGTATVTATADSGVSATATVIVKNDIEMTGLTLKDVEVKAGKTALAYYTCTPSNATSKLTWSVEDTSVATVDESGAVKGVSEGTTTLTAKSDNGLEATAQITVLGEPYVYFQYNDGRIQKMDENNTFTLGILDEGKFVLANAVGEASWDCSGWVSDDYGGGSYHDWIDWDSNWVPSGTTPAKAYVYDTGTWNEYSFSIKNAPSGITALKTYIDGKEVTADDPYFMEGTGKAVVSAKGLKDGEWIDVPAQALNYTCDYKMENSGDYFRFLGSTMEVTGRGEATVTVSLKGESVSTSFAAQCGAVGVTGMTVTVPETFKISVFSDYTNRYFGVAPKNGYSIAFEPSNATNRNVTWEALTPDIAYHVDTDAAGIVPIKAGTARFRVTSDDNPEVSQEVSVTFEYAHPLTSVATDGDLTMDAGKSQSLRIAAEPENATEQRFHWTYSKEGIVKVEDLVTTAIGGVSGHTTSHSITALKAGEVTVTGTPYDTTGGCQPVIFTVTVGSGGEQEKIDYLAMAKEDIGHGLDYLAGQSKNKYGDEWTIFTAIRAGLNLSDADKNAYYASVKEQLDSGRQMMPTDYARLALTLGVMGRDPADFEGYDLVEKLYSGDLSDATSNWVAWTLIALDSRDYQVPADKWTQEKLVSELLQFQASDGSFGLSKTDATGSVDMTGMALQALAGYDDGDHPAVQAAFEKGLGYLKDQISLSDCGYAGNACSTAQVLTALTAAGIDPADPENGFGVGVSNMITNLHTFRLEAGFKYQDSASDANLMGCQQITYALESYRRFAENCNGLYDLRDVDTETKPADPADQVAAGAVDALIDAIGQVTLGSANAVKTARAAYDALTSGQKVLVTKYDTLLAAEETLKWLQTPEDKKITVTFSLLGDTAHGAPAAGSTHTLAKGGLSQWIAPTTYTISANDTVWTVLKKALADNHMTCDNPSGNYVKSITKDGVTLGEFTNGKLSGWMYTLNGEHPDLGVSEQRLQDKDVIVFHYTDDYTAERGSEKWQNPGEAVQPVTQDVAAAIKGDSAEASVSAADLAVLAGAAAASGADKVQLNITGADKADKVSVELPKTAVSNIANQTDADLTVTTPLGNVTLDKAAMNAAVKAASGSDITIVLEKQEIADANKEILGSGAVQTKVSILSGGKAITDLGAARIKILLPVADELKDKTLAAASVAADGKLTKAEGQAVTVDGKTYYQIETSKPGSFVVAEPFPADDPLEDETDAEKLARIKKGVQNTTITITGTSKGKGWIKVNWKKSLGYKVDYYEVFRKTGKSGKFGTTAFYKTKKHGITGWYKNTKSLKKGNRYYYKVRGVRILDGKKVYTKWSKTVYRIAK